MITQLVYKYSVICRSFIYFTQQDYLNNCMHDKV